MKKILYMVALLAGLLVAMPSCHKGNDSESQVNQDSIDKLALSDSLATIRAEKDTLATLMNEVSEGMNQIIEMQNILNVENINADTPGKKARLRNNVLAIQQAIAERTQRVADLEKRLKSSTIYTDEMKKQVSTLKKQLENQQTMINQLTAQLQAAHVQINTLNTRVDSLKTENTKVNESYTAEKAKTQDQANRLNDLTNEMNVCYYVVGSKSELKKQKIIETGFLRKTKVMEGDYTQSYFTKADKRTLQSINLHSRKAEVISKHPMNSYRIEDAGGQKVLRITNPARFWELSNYLVVKIG